MRIVTNDKLVKRNTKLAQYVLFGTMGVLILSFFAPTFLLDNRSIDEGLATFLAYGLPTLILPIALITTIISVRMTNLWIRRPRPENALEEGLKGLSTKSVLYSYYHFPARHVLICPQGVFAIVTRFQDGRHSVDGEKWRSKRGLFGSLLSMFRFDGVGNPTYDAYRAAQRVQAKLEPIAPDVEVQPLVIFVDPRADLDITKPAVPVLYANPKSEPCLRSFLRDIKTEEEDEPEEPKTKGRKPKAKKAKTPVMPLTDEQINAFEEATL